MMIVEGGHYKTRDGRFVGPMRYDHYLMVWRDRSAPEKVGAYWYPSGSWYGGMPSGNDLVEQRTRPFSDRGNRATGDSLQPGQCTMLQLFKRRGPSWRCRIEWKVNHIMATQQDLIDALNSASDKITAVKKDTEGLLAKITELQNNPPSGMTPDQQQTLDKAVVLAQDINNRLTSLDGEVADVDTTPTTPTTGDTGGTVTPPAPPADQTPPAPAADQVPVTPPADQAPADTATPPADAGATPGATTTPVADGGLAGGRRR